MRDPDLFCHNCNELHDSKCMESRACKYCGSEEVGDLALTDALGLLWDAIAREKQALKAMAEAQMAAGAFQTQARLAEQRVEQVERELAAYKRHIAESAT